MQPISRIIRNQQYRALARRRHLHGRHHLLCARRRKDIPAGRGRQQTFADEAAPFRLVAGAAATVDAYCLRFL
jgi:hypothetical protein